MREPIRIKFSDFIKTYDDYINLWIKEPERKGGKIYKTNNAKLLGGEDEELYSKLRDYYVDQWTIEWAVQDDGDLKENHPYIAIYLW